MASLSQSCRPTPKLDVEFWAGDSQRKNGTDECTGGITRAQEGKFIPANAPGFDKFACLTYEDVQEIFMVMQKCKKWEGPTHMINRNDISWILPAHNQVGDE